MLRDDTLDVENDVIGADDEAFGILTDLGVVVHRDVERLDAGGVGEAECAKEASRHRPEQPFARGRKVALTTVTIAAISGSAGRGDGGRFIDRIAPKDVQLFGEKVARIHILGVRDSVTVVARDFDADS